MQKKIICIEPITECIPILKQNLRENRICEKSAVINKGVGERGILYMEKDSSVNLSRVVEKKVEDVREVPSEDIYYFAEKYDANLLRMDVEGYEYKILEKGIPEKINKISMEFHTVLIGEEKSIILLKMFEENGFYVDTIIEDLPLRLYPFYTVLKKTKLMNIFTYKKRNLRPTECISLVTKGRAIKYLFLRKTP